MTVQELIDYLQTIEDKEMKIWIESDWFEHVGIFQETILAHEGYYLTPAAIWIENVKGEKCLCF